MSRIDRPTVCSSNDQAELILQRLELRLFAFYNKNSAYYECAQDSDKSHFFQPIAKLVRDRSDSGQKVRILEVGAGKSGLPDFLRTEISKENYTYTAHDVNDTNRAYYETRNIELLVGDIFQQNLKVKYDLIVSLFVWEHLTRPAQALEWMCKSLSECGSIIIVCPKYTLPLYIPPAIRHLRKIEQLRENVLLAADYLLVRAGFKKPGFRVVIDPAVLHLQWRRDYDAVHMVSSADLRARLGPTWKVVPLDVRYQSRLAAILAKGMLLTVAVHRKNTTVTSLVDRL